MPYGVNIDADEFYRRLQQNEELKKIVGTSLKTHCQNLKEDAQNASDFSSAQQVITNCEGVFLFFGHSQLFGLPFNIFIFMEPRILTAGDTKHKPEFEYISNRKCPVYVSSLVPLWLEGFPFGFLFRF